MTTIDVISDVICPWCYVDKRRLEKAAALPVPKMTFGRVCLTGDAAFVPRPHTAASTAKAAANALALADCLTAADGDVVEAMRRWEPAQLNYGEQLGVHGQRLGIAHSSTDPHDGARRRWRI